MIGENENATEYWSSITHLSEQQTESKAKLTTAAPSTLPGANHRTACGPPMRARIRPRVSFRIDGLLLCVLRCVRARVQAMGRAPLLVEQQHGLAVIVRHRHDHLAVPKLVAALRDDERVALRQNLRANGTARVSVTSECHAHAAALAGQRLAVCSVRGRARIGVRTRLRRRSGPCARTAEGGHYY